MLGVHGCDDDSGAGVESNVGGGVIGDVLWRSVHPGAEKNGGGGCRKRKRRGGRFIEADHF